MPTFQFEAMDSTGQEIKDVIDAPSEEEAQATIRQMGYYVTKLQVKKNRKKEEKKGSKKGKTFAMGGVKSKVLCTFTRQLSTLQDAGLPILRSLQILENQARPGALKNSLIDVCDDIEGGATLSEAMGKVPKAFDRLYVNMVKAGEAGGALEIVLQRLAEFQEKSQSLKRKVKGAMVYPSVVIFVASAILTFIMAFIVPKFKKIFADFGTELPAPTQVLMSVSEWVVNYFYLIPGIPILIWLWIKMWRKFRFGRVGWDLFALQFPIFGGIINKTIMARTTRTLGTLVASGVPILEALNIAKETSGSAVFESLYGKIYDSVREGESIAMPMREHSKPGFNAMALFFWLNPALFVTAIFLYGMPNLALVLGGSCAAMGGLMYFMKYKNRVVDDIVVNMVDVGEETGELDKMLYKVADVYDEEVDVAVESLVSMLEPLMIVILGLMVGFIVIALFMPLISLIEKLS